MSANLSREVACARAERAAEALAMDPRVRLVFLFGSSTSTRCSIPRVLDHLAKAPADFGDFIAAIRRWLDAQPA